MFVAYILFNKHFSKNTEKILPQTSHIHVGVRLMIKQCTCIYAFPVAPTTNVSLISITVLSSAPSCHQGDDMAASCGRDAPSCPVVPSVFR